MTELSDLTGKHWLTGCDSTETTVQDEWGSESADVLNFVLDGVTYSAIENPDDGYRSMLGELKVSDAKLTNMFPACEVIGSLRTKNSSEYGGEDDVLELRDVATGKLVLEVGTENIDDYYPGFVAAFHPENMFINRGVTP